MCLHTCVQRNLKIAIQQSEQDCLEQLCTEPDINRRLTAHSAVMGRFKIYEASQVACPGLLLKLVKGYILRRAIGLKAFNGGRCGINIPNDNEKSTGDLQ